MAENINDLQAASSYGISIAPNPAKDQLHINVNNLKTVVRSLQILNAAGIKVAEKTFTNNAGNLSINVSGYAPGLYILRINTSDGVITKKFIKE